MPAQEDPTGKEDLDDDARRHEKQCQSWVLRETRTGTGHTQGDEGEAIRVVIRVVMAQIANQPEQIQSKGFGREVGRHQTPS
jgi:hypothetical protein